MNDHDEESPHILIAALLWTVSVLSLVAFASCKSTDIQPDEFRVDYGHGDMNVSGSRPDMYEDMYSVGLTWYIGDVAKRDHEEAFEEFMRTWKPEVTVKQEPATVPVPIASEPEPVLAIASEEHKQPAQVVEPPAEEHKDALYYIPGFAVAVLGALLGRKSA